MIPPLYVKASVLKSDLRGKIRINDQVDVSQTDIVVQDGVIHEIDDILLPPKPRTESGDSERESFWERTRAKLLGPRSMTVEELMERFEPYLEQGVADV
jgi:hypothetical protein